MILDNDFPEYTETAEKIDRELAYVNFIIRRLNEDKVPYVRNGIIYIPEKKGPGRFSADITHEGAHLVRDPITYPDYAEGIHAIHSLVCPNDMREAADLANRASDLIIENWISRRSKTLREIMLPDILALWRAHSSNKDPKWLALMQAYGQIYGLREIPLTMPDFWEKIKTALRDPDRLSKYVKIAQAFTELPSTPAPPPEDEKPQENQSGEGEQEQSQDQQQSGSGQSKDEDKGQDEQGSGDEEEDTDADDDKDGEDEDGEGDRQEKQKTKHQSESEQTEEEDKGEYEARPAEPDAPINPTHEDMQTAIETAMQNSQDDSELRERLEELSAIGAGVGAEELQELQNDQWLRILRFYETKAAKITLAIDFPKRASRTATELSTRKWRFSDGLQAIDHAATIMKKGINVPLVTAQTPQTFNRVRLDRRGRESRPLIMSFDCSGSTGPRFGTMREIRDWEAITFLAILRQARKLGQQIGFDFWHDYLAKEAKPTDPRQFTELKRQFFQNYPGPMYGTSITPALHKIKQKPDEAFMLITDGIISEGREQLSNEARGISNTLVLIFAQFDPDAAQNQRDEYVPAFQEAFGANRVLFIEKLTDLPKIALKSWRDWFWA
ncbi:MAG: hypothetical protein WCC94_02980 [Candidatus Bathyarchaeia archaeon]